MDENTEKKQNELLKELTEEQRLLRTAEKDSIRAVNVELEKFTEIADVMNKNILHQGEILVDLLDTQKNLLEIEDENIRKERKRLELEKVQQNIIGDKSNVVASGTDDLNSIKNTFGGSGIAPMLSKIGPGIGGFMSAIIGGATAALSGISLYRLGGLVLRAVPLAILAPFIGEFIGTFAEESIRNILSIGLPEGGNFSDEFDSFLTGFGEAMVKGGTWASIGLIFGRRYAAIFGLAGIGSNVLSPKLEKFLKKSGYSEDGIIEAFGEQFDASGVATTVATLLSGGISLALLSPRLWARVGIPGLVITGVLAFSKNLKDWLEEQGMNQQITQDLVDTTSFTAIGASLGMMFGPKGAIIGAAIGLAIGMGAAVVRWLNRVRDRQKDIFDEEVAETMSMIDKVMSENRDFTPEELQQIHSTILSAERRRTLAGTSGERSQLDEISESMRNILGEHYNQSYVDTAHENSIDSAFRFIMDTRKPEEQRRAKALELYNTIGFRDIDMLKDAPYEGHMTSVFQGINGAPDFGKIREYQNAIDSLLTPDVLESSDIITPINRRNTVPEVQIETNPPPIMTSDDRISEMLGLVTQPAVTVNNIYAPTNVAPVAQIQGGGTSVVSNNAPQITSFGNGTADGGLGKFAH